MYELCISSGVTAGRYPTERGAALLSAAGFEAVDYATFSKYRHFEGLFAEPDAGFSAFFAAEKKAYAEAGIRIAQIHCPFNCPPDDVTEEELRFFMASVRRSLKAAVILEAPIAVLHPIIPVGWDRDSSRSFALTEQLCTDCLEEAERLGLKLALENMPGNDTTVPYSSAPPFLALFKKLPQLGACLDTGHANWALPRGSVPDMARQLGGRLYTVHLHDNGGTWDNHFFPFGGTVTWNELCRALGEIGYKGPVNLETGCAGMNEMSDELFFQCLLYQCAIARELRGKIAQAKGN